MKPGASPFLFLLILFVSFVPYNTQALTIPPVDMFQLPWQLGESWIAMSGFDNGTLREKSSPHNFNMGGAVDFAPHIGMKIGEDTSNAWVTAAAAGRVIETSTCHIKIDHGNGWTTEYYHLGRIQVAKGNSVNRNQRLAIIDNNENDRVCVGNRWPGPHLHFVLRPNMRNATLAGWMINYDQVSNITTFTKNSQTVGLFQPMLNSMDGASSTATPTIAPPTTPTPVSTGSVSPTPVGLPSPTPTFVVTDVFSPTPTPISTDFASPTPISTDVLSPTPTSFPTDWLPATPTPGFETPTPAATTISGLHVVTVANPTTLLVGEMSQISVYLNNVPAEGLTSVEFTCNYNPSLYIPPLFEASNFAMTDLFGADAAMAMNGPQNGKFIFAIAGSNGKKAMTSGVALTFNLKGIQIGQSTIVCTARVSKGDNLLTDIPHIPASLSILGTMITPTPTASLPPSYTPIVLGQVSASKPVTIRLYNAENQPVVSTLASPDGSFSLTFPAGTYTITAIAEGFLNAQGTITMMNGNTISMPLIALPAGDIDGNTVIDQFDAMTIGMSYNTAVPSAADLNNDGVINVLDLELLAANYRKSGALMWQ